MVGSPRKRLGRSPACSHISVVSSPTPAQVVRQLYGRNPVETTHSSDVESPDAQQPTTGEPESAPRLSRAVDRHSPFDLRPALSPGHSRPTVILLSKIQAPMACLRPGAGARDRAARKKSDLGGPARPITGEAAHRSTSLVPRPELVGKRFIPVMQELPSAASQRIAVSVPRSPGTIDVGRPPPPVGMSRTGHDVRPSRRS
jgi:hypothetical protein